MGFVMPLDFPSMIFLAHAKSNENQSVYSIFLAICDASGEWVGICFHQQPGGSQGTHRKTEGNKHHRHV